METQPICRDGIVRKIEDGCLLVEITISSACGQCRAKSICMPSERKQELIEAQNPYNQTFTIGEVVTLNLQSSAGRKAVVLGYLMPFVVLLASFLLTFLLTDKEWIPVLVSLACTFLYFVVLYRFKKRMDEQFTFYVTKKEC